MLIYNISGAYVPLTKEGNNIVDGVLASCYPSVNHDVSHFGLILMKWFPEIVEQIFSDDDGLHNFANIGKNILEIINLNDEQYKSAL